MKRSTALKSDQVQALVLVEIDKEPWADSRGIAFDLGVKHENTLDLIDKNLSDFETLGHVRFETDYGNRVQGGGRPTRYAMLNEAQCNFLLTLVKITKKSKPKKLLLVQKFQAYKVLAKKAQDQAKRQADRRKDPEWQQIRGGGKVVRKSAMGSADRFVDYAKAQGSTNADRYFSTLSSLTNARLGIVVPPKGATRDGLDAETLQAIQDVETLESAALLEAMSQGLPYKEVFPLVKARVYALNVVALRPAPTPTPSLPLPPADAQPSLFGDFE